MAIWLSEITSGGLGVGAWSVTTDSTGLDATLTASQTNIVYIINNGAANVILNISACIVAANIGKEIEFLKIGAGTVRIEPGAKIIKSSVGGVGYVQNTTTETYAMFRLRIVSATIANMIAYSGSWDYET